MRDEFSTIYRKLRCLCQDIEALQDAVGSGANIYNTSDSLTGNRVVTGAGFDLTFTGIDDYTISSASFLLNTTGSITLTALSSTNFGGSDINFNSVLPSETTPDSFLVTSNVGAGQLRFSTVSEMQTALGIGAAALTAGYVAYGTGTGITGEAEFFYDTANNRLGIGTATPSTSLHISAGAANGVITLESDNAAFMSIYRYSNNVTRPRYETYKARGTKATPLTILTGDELAAFDFYGHNGTSFARNATIFTTARNVSGTDITAQMNFGFGFSAGATDHYQAFSAAGALFTNTTATSKTPTSIVDINRDNLGAVQTTSSGLALTNNTLATDAARVQVSPAIRFLGNGWKTNATAASQTVEFRMHVLPVTGTSAPTGTFIIASSIAGGAYGNQISLGSDGVFTAATITGTTGVLSNFSSINTTSVGYFNFGTGTRSRMSSPADGSILFQNNALTGFDYLMFGGTTSSFPSLKRSGTGLEVRLADNSAYAPLTCSTLATSSIVSASGGYVNSSGNSVYQGSGTSVHTSGNISVFDQTRSFAPTSGTGTFTSFAFTGTINQTGGANGITRGLYINPTLTAAADFRAIEVTGGTINVSKTITTPGTTGNQTINKLAGTVNIAAAGTTVTVTNSLVTANSIIMCTVQTNDTTALLKNVVPAAGSFVINMNVAVTAETAIAFFVVN